MIDVYGMSSPNVLKIIIALEELGFDYTFHNVDVVAGEQYGPEFVALNPLSKVPVIVDHDSFNGEPYTVFESGAILMYLAEKAGNLIPKDPRARMETMQWLVLQIANVGPYFGQHTHFLRHAPPDNEYSASRYRTLAGRVYDTLDKRLGVSAYLAGDEYTIADVATYPWAALYHDFHGMLWNDHPHLRRWCDLIAQRPAVIRSAAVHADIAANDPARSPNPSSEGVDRFFGRGAFARK
ncbi:glutathione S-transferase family protein [Sphingobium chlorophenolicum]|uniref:GST-like protein n=1 Tax=Sphingobium chlorophenolicum TaxID=46429 RepID=A0A081R9C6_SPHCR|nr:glutathione binding-like protein [Sphingobium chlorophenolicum]KEQ51799.1 GST-like protein [Sphingobium chlorophenolicum]